jgi:arylformamidase
MEPLEPERVPWIDISRPIRGMTPVWPGDRPFVLSQRCEPGFVLSSFETTCHIATHVDAPLHLDTAAAAVEAIPIGRCVGPADVVRIEGAARALTPADLPGGWKPRSPRVLLRTDSFPLDVEIGPGFAGLSAQLVHWLADRGVELVGIDTPSVDLFESGDLPAHHALMERGVTWIEGLWLAGAEPGRYFLAALPLLLEGAEAAPARAVLAPLRGEF